VGHENDRAADRLHDGHAVRGADRPQARPRPAARPPTLRRPTALSDRPRCAGHLLHASHRLTEDRDGHTAPLTTAQTDPPLVRGGPPAPPRHDHEQSSGSGASPARGQGQHQAESAHPRGPGPDGHRAFARRESRIRVAHLGGAKRGLAACRKL
jgi:hypothetical protein